MSSPVSFKDINEENIITVLKNLVIYGATVTNNQDILNQLHSIKNIISQSPQKRKLVDSIVNDMTDTSMFSSQDTFERCNPTLGSIFTSENSSFSEQYSTTESTHSSKRISSPPQEKDLLASPKEEAEDNRPLIANEIKKSPEERKNEIEALVAKIPDRPATNSAAHHANPPETVKRAASVDVATPPSEPYCVMCEAPHDSCRSRANSLDHPVQSSKPKSRKASRQYHQNVKNTQEDIHSSVSAESTQSNQSGQSLRQLFIQQNKNQPQQQQRERGNSIPHNQPQLVSSYNPQAKLAPPQLVPTRKLSLHSIESPVQKQPQQPIEPSQTDRKLSQEAKIRHFIRGEEEPFVMPPQQPRKSSNIYKQPIIPIPAPPRKNSNSEITVNNVTTDSVDSKLQNYLKNVKSLKDKTAQIQIYRIMITMLKQHSHDLGSDKTKSFHANIVDGLRKLKDAEANYILGGLYKNGLIDGERNWDKAFKYYSLGSKAGHQRCRYYTAYCCSRGIGTKVDPNVANRYFISSANSNIVEAMVHCGDMFLFGINNSQIDHDQARYWYRNAAFTNDHSESKMYALFRLGFEYINSDHEHDQDYAFEVLEKASQCNYGPAIYGMGCCLEFGIGTDKNEVMANQLYQKAAQYGFTDVETLGVLRAPL